jgi:hypothetical protein
VMLGRLVLGVTGVAPAGAAPLVSDEFHAVFAGYEVLAAIARMPGVSSRQVCEVVSGSEGDSLRLLDLLEELELVRHAGRFPDVWHLTYEGVAVLNARTRMTLQQQQLGLTATEQINHAPCGAYKEASR